MPARNPAAGSARNRLKNFIPGWRASARLRGGFDVTLLALVLILMGLGLLMVLSSSYPRAYYEAIQYESGSPLTYFNHQLIFAVGGIVILYAASWIPMSVYRQGAKLLFLFALVTLALVLIVGAAKNNARRWISLGFFSFQPSALVLMP